MNNEIERKIIKEGFFTEAIYPFTIKPNFSTYGSVVEISLNITDKQIAFDLDDSMRNILRFKPVTIHDEHPSDFTFDIFSFDNFFLETDVAQVMILKGNRTGIVHSFLMNFHPGYKCIE